MLEAQLGKGEEAPLQAFTEMITGVIGSHGTM